MLNHLAVSETVLAEQLEAGIVEAGRLRSQLDATRDEADRAVIRKQLQQVERRVESLRRQLRG